LSGKKFCEKWNDEQEKNVFVCKNIKLSIIVETFQIIYYNENNNLKKITIHRSALENFEKFFSIKTYRKDEVCAVHKKWKD